MTFRILSIPLIVLCLAGCRHKEATQQAEAPAQQDSVMMAEDTFVLPSHDSLFIDSVLTAEPFFAHQAERIFNFYRARDFRPAWFNEHGLAEQTGEVVNLITDYLDAGVVDSSVFLKGIGALYDTLSAEDFSVRSNVSRVLAADVLFTGQFFAFSDKAWRGKYAGSQKDLAWFIPAKKFSEEAYLDSLLRMKPTDIRGSEPVFAHYHALRNKLRELVQIRRQGGWNTLDVPETTPLFGDSSEFVASLRKRLALSEGAVYDSALFYALKSFQECHGMNPDGKPDKRTIAELNVPVDKRIRKVMINLERWKWIPPDAGDDFIAVNIPEFKLHVYENGKEVWDMRVIVGKNANQTVIFSGDMKYVVFTPYWNVPRSIAVKEILPKVKHNRNYLASHHMEVVSGGKAVPASSVNWASYSGNNFPYNFRQKPGDHNSLGLVKFLFPNSYAIYLHDTPTKWLFEKEDRDFSHGCIRLSEPAKLAEYILRNDARWNSEKIRKAMRSGKEEYVTLQKTIPVYITYFTSWVDKQGRLNFRDDVYRHDRKLEKTLF